MPEWNEQFEVPDVVGYQDYAFSAKPFVTEVANRGPNWTPDRLLLFPYPNGRAKTRQLAVADIGDLLILRSAAGRVAATVDSQLAQEVRSNRLAKAPPAWAFKSSRRAHKGFRQAAVQRLQQGDCAALIKTDVQRYYPSVDLEELRRRLVLWPCDMQALDLLVRVFHHWATWHNLRGLPVGPEASAVLGNGYLYPVDDLLRSVGVDHLRWMDDLLLFPEESEACDDLLEMLDARLRDLRLERSTEKTEVIENMDRAIESVESSVLTSLGFVLLADPPRGEAELHRQFDEKVTNQETVDASSYRWLVGTMRNRRDSHAAAWLSEDLERMNIDPRASAGYMASVMLDSKSVVDDLFNHLEGPPDERRDAISLHLLRGLPLERLGAAEMNVVRDIARRGAHSAPVRAWAWMASSRGHPSRPGDAMTAVLHTEDPLVRRAALLSLKRTEPTRSRAWFLKHVRQTVPELRFSVRWLEAG